MNAARIILLLSFFAAFSSCGGNGSNNDFFASAQVLDLTLENSRIKVGEGTVLAVEFFFDPVRIFDKDKSIKVVVHLPPGVELRDGTSEIDGNSNDKKVGAQVTFCHGGESYLLFDMDRFDLGDAFDPPGDPDAALTLTVDGTLPVDLAPIEAAAGDEVPFFECGGRFIPDQQAGITVAP